MKDFDSGTEIRVYIEIAHMQQAASSPLNFLTVH